jgi:hypothetical protein
MQKYLPYQIQMRDPGNWPERSEKAEVLAHGVQGRMQDSGETGRSEGQLELEGAKNTPGIQEK